MTEPTIRILSTRPLEQGLLDQAARAGIRIDSLSFIDTKPIRDTALTHQVQQLGSQPLTAVFTSMNAVEAVAGHLAQQPAPEDSPTRPPWRVFCIGAATRRLAEAQLGPAAGTAPSAAALADVILEHHLSEVFFFCGDRRREELPGRLTTAGVEVHEVVVYRTTQTPHTVKGPYDGIVFFSPSAVHSFFSVNSTTEKTILFAIGKTTAETIHTYVNNSVITSATPEKEGLVRQLIDYYERLKGARP
ncbi:MAG: hypothetical protein BGO55_15770 [Sphingobacteriales bacterium 50-39]|nr:uroporphyrinogen-III synthase [Sphingobacteriales bacterium]OJW54820.1 MAG: hypothetical protein BGO55_15770 [Sphingobacteriales bacterium 50-39]